MSRLSEIVGVFAEIDAALFALVAIVLGVLAFTRKRRPFAMSRAMDVAISTVLFIMLGIRYVVLAALTLVFPAQIAGSAAGPTFADHGAAESHDSILSEHSEASHLDVFSAHPGDGQRGRG